VDGWIQLRTSLHGVDGMAARSVENMNRDKKMDTFQPCSEFDLKFAVEDVPRERQRAASIDGHAKVNELTLPDGSVKMVYARHSGHIANSLGSAPLHKTTTIDVTR
jgi:hypothetical protein